MDIKHLLQKYKQPVKKKQPPHPLSACSDEIEKAGIFTTRYKRGYWLRQLSVYQKKHNLEPEVLYTRLLGVLKNMEGMDAKYSRGGTLTNKLKRAEV